jgi:hypothetical protein
MNRIELDERAPRRPGFDDSGGWFVLGDGREYALPTVRGVLGWRPGDEGTTPTLRWYVGHGFDRQFQGRFAAYRDFVERIVGRPGPLDEGAVYGSGAALLLAMNYEIDLQVALALVAGAPDHRAIFDKVHELLFENLSRDELRIDATLPGAGAGARN